MKYKGAIFDMDGVLFDTERLYQDIWQELAREHGVELGSGFVKDISGTNGSRMLKTVEKYYRVSDGSAIVDTCMRRMKEELSIHVPVKEGVFEILRFLKEKGIRTAVASSTARERINENLQRAGIRDYFMEIVSGSEVKNGKPAPDIFLCAAERIGCSPEECFVFEDSENGVRAGFAAGCVTIMIPDLLEPETEIRSCCFKICRNLPEVQKEISDML